MTGMLESADETNAETWRAATPTAASANAGGRRDERIDFMRGFACLSFVTAHFEAFTYLHMVFWERLGFVSGAEIFILLSGFLIGSVHRRVLDGPDAEKSALRLWRRASVLYLGYVGLTVIVMLVARLHLLDMTAVTTFTDRSSGRTYVLVPSGGVSIFEQTRNILLLRGTPHQVQILGLYMVLLALTPFVLVLLRRGHDFFCIVASLALWSANLLHPMTPTGAQFEFGFPLLAWQLYFYMALIAGYRRAEIAIWLASHPRSHHLLWGAAIAVALASFVLAQATDNADFPSWYRLDLIETRKFRAFYDLWLVKNTASPLRVLCAVSFTLCFYGLLGLAWPQARRWLGWLLIPLGQASLYVFLIHVPFIAAADQIPGYFDGPTRYDPHTVFFNTGVLVAILAAIWLMVRCRILFRVIPR